MSHRFPLLLVAFFPALAQNRAEIGVRADTPLAGGIRAESDFSYCGPAPRPYYYCGFFMSASRHVWPGLSASVPVTRRLRLRADPIYQRIGFDLSSYGAVSEKGPDSAFGIAAGKTATSSNRWEFPLLAERSLTRRVRAGVGPALSMITGHRRAIEIRSPFAPVQTIDDHLFGRVDRAVVPGFAAAVEAPIRAGLLTLAPEIRYTRWLSRHYSNWRLDQLTFGVALRL